MLFLPVLLLPVDNTLASQQRCPRPNEAQCCRDIEHRVQALHLYPRNAPKSAAVGGRCAMARGACPGTPFVISTVERVAGSAAARPSVTILKKRPMLTRVALFWKVARIPEEAPRVSGGTLLIIELVLGEANKPDPQPSMKGSTAKTGLLKLAGSKVSPRKPSTWRSMPVVEKRRAPKRSERYPLMRPITMKPSSRGSIRLPAHKGVSAKL